ncbi:MAG: CIA30 family protein [Cyanobacteria bacterium P01_H01_bin.15]
MTKAPKSWDLGRFVQTLADFDVVPFLRPLTQLLQGQSPQILSTMTQPSPQTLLVAGAVNGTQSSVISDLLAQGFFVKVIAIDTEQWAFQHPHLTLLSVDLNQPTSLTPDLFINLSTIICLPGLEPSALQTLLTAAQGHLLPPDSRILFDFSQPLTTALKETWRAVDDVVMGGVSRSSIRIVDSDRAVFTGVVSTDNNGGFASVRTRDFQPPWDLSSFTEFGLVVKGDGKRYKFIVRSEDRWDGVGYSRSFDTQPGLWQTITVPINELIPVFRAKTLNDSQLLRSQIYAMQLMHSKFEYNRELNPTFSPGLFTLELKNIFASGGHPKPQIVLLDATAPTVEALQNFRYQVLSPNQFNAKTFLTHC